MTGRKIFLCSLIVSVLSLASVVVGFLSFKLSGAEHQLLVQIPVTLAVGVLMIMGSVIWFRRAFGLEAGADKMAVILLALPLGAVVFTGLHYVMTGYLTSFGNIGPLWGLQFAENMFAFPLAAELEKRMLRQKNALHSG